MEPLVYKSKYLLRVLRGDYNPLTPNVLLLDEDHAVFRRRNWYLISSDSESLSFHNITGITIDKHLFGASVTIKSKGSDPIEVHGFSKGQANEIRDYCQAKIDEKSGRATAEAVNEAVKKAMQDGNGHHPSVADELMKYKKLLDEGALTEQEYERQKRKLISG